MDRDFNGIQDGNEEPCRELRLQPMHFQPGDGKLKPPLDLMATYILDGVAQELLCKIHSAGSFRFTHTTCWIDNMDNDMDGTNSYGTTQMYRGTNRRCLPDHRCRVGIRFFHWSG
ncbi:MAG: hypothetical protein IPN15_17870 [Saprospiraceae bacterium]|nr:hypothetical protein [Candidatus Vicinibacter affinis]